MNESLKKYYQVLAEKTITAMNERGFQTYLTKSKEDALMMIQQIIPAGANVMTGGSMTIEELGFTKMLDGTRYNYLKKEILKENDPEKRRTLRRKALTSDYYVASANAIASTGEIILIDHGGSRVSAYSYAAKNVIIVTGVNKISWDLDEAIKRARNYAGPLEAIRTGENFPYGSIGKTLIIERESVPKRITVIFIMDVLGF